MRNRPCRSKKIDASCFKCGKQKSISLESFNVNVSKNGSYTCHQCGVARAASLGLLKQNSELRAARTRKLWQDKAFREKVTTASKAAVSTAEAKEKASMATKKLWDDPDYARRVSAAITKKFSNDPLYKKRCSDGLRRKWCDNDYKTKQAIANSCRPHISSLQIKLYEMLDLLKADYESESEKTVIGYYSFDCLVRVNNRRTLLIECQGDYFHSRPGTCRTDAAKFTYIDKYFPNYEIMYLWEHEFATKDRVLDRLKCKLGIKTDTIDFDFESVAIRSVVAADVNKFLDAYHYIGKGRGGKAFGAFIGDELIAVAVFGPPIRQGVATGIGVSDCVELARFCIHPFYHKKNFGSWLLARLLKNFSVPVVAFSDTTVAHNGGLYKASNFKQHHRTQSDYWYVDNDGYVMHKKTLYNRAIKCHLTERQFASKFGFAKKYGGTKICWVYGLCSAGS